jgi:hypothetical protein
MKIERLSIDLVSLFFHLNFGKLDFNKKSLYFRDPENKLK